MNSEVIAPGIIKYSSCFDVSDEEITWILERTQKAFEANYEFFYDDDGELLYGLNESHHKIPAEHIFNLPIRVYDELRFDLVDRLEKATYRALLEYVSTYQDVLHSIWWRTLGSFAVYPAGTCLDVHSDNDINYRPGTTPIDQVAVHHVLSSTAIIGDDFTGGDIYFEYFGNRVKLKKGDILFFPSNYIYAHCVELVSQGTRISYLSWYGHGSPNPDISLVVNQPAEGQYGPGKVWMDRLYDDYAKLVESGNPDLRRAFERAVDH